MLPIHLDINSQMLNNQISIDDILKLRLYEHIGGQAVHKNSLILPLYERKITSGWENQRTLIMYMIYPNLHILSLR